MPGVSGRREGEQEDGERPPASPNGALRGQRLCARKREVARARGCTSGGGKSGEVGGGGKKEEGVPELAPRSAWRTAATTDRVDGQRPRPLPHHRRRRRRRHPHTPSTVAQQGSRATDGARWARTRKEQDKKKKTARARRHARLHARQTGGGGGRQGTHTAGARPPPPPPPRRQSDPLSTPPPTSPPTPPHSLLPTAEHWSLRSAPTGARRRAGGRRASPVDRRAPCRVAQPRHAFTTTDGREPGAGPFPPPSSTHTERPRIPLPRSGQDGGSRKRGAGGNHRGGGVEGGGCHPKSGRTVAHAAHCAATRRFGRPAQCRRPR